MPRRDLWLLIVISIILLYIMPYLIIVDGSSPQSITGVIGVLWDTNPRVLPPEISRVSLHAPFLLTVVLLAPGLYYLLNLNRVEERHKERGNYKHQMLTILVISWCALLLLVPKSTWIYEGVPLKPIEDYYVSFPNFVTLILILFVVVPSLLHHPARRTVTGQVRETEYQKKPLYKQPGFILLIIIFLIPDFVSFHSHSTKVWSSQSYVEFGTIGWTVGIQLIRTFNQVSTSMFISIAPAPAFPAMVLRWIISLAFVHQVLSFLRDEIPHRQAIISTLLSLLGLVFLSIMYSTDFLIGEYLRFPIPFPVLQLIGFSLIQEHQESKEKVAEDPEHNLVRVPFLYILYSKVLKQLGRDSEVS